MTSSRQPSRDEFLAIYLNDHLSGAVGGIELARRSLGNNRGTDLGALLRQILGEIVEDRHTLEELMAALDIEVDRLKLAGAYLAEKVGRFKLNGSLRGYTELGRLIELDGLYGGIDLKLRLWRGMRRVVEDDPRLAVIDFDRLIDRATSQLERLEPKREEAYERTFAPR